MLATELIQKLQELVEKHGDKEVVSGLERSGYGEPVWNVTYCDENVWDTVSRPVRVFNVELSDESTCAIGGF